MFKAKVFSYPCSMYFFYKKHACPHCEKILQRRRREKTVNSHSEEAKYYDFENIDTYLVGDVTFVTFYFECPECKTTYEILELKKIEKGMRKNRRKDRRRFP